MFAFSRPVTPVNVAVPPGFLGYVQLMLKLGVAEGNPGPPVTFQRQQTPRMRGFDMPNRGFF